MKLGFAYLEYSNDEVEFTVGIPWSASAGVSDEDAVMSALMYLSENFGLDPMVCTESYVEWE